MSHANFVGNLSEFLENKNSIKSYLTPTSGFFYDATLVEKIQSEYQLVSIWHSTDLGYTLVLDDQLMCTQNDEFYYHEALIYPALIYQYDLKKENLLDILIIGGGDGGSCEEILKYPYLKSIDWVEIDKEVVNLSQKYLKSVHNNCLSNALVQLKIEDGFEYVKNTKKTYDIIYLDLNDPIGNNPVVNLYTPQFFNHLKHSLKENALAVMQIAAHHNAGFNKALNLAANEFETVVLYKAFCPSYHCENYFLILSAHELNQIEKSLAAQNLFDLKSFGTQIIDADNFSAMFSIAKNLKTKLEIAV